MGKEAEAREQKNERPGSALVARPDVLRSFGALLDRVQASRSGTLSSTRADDKQAIGDGL